MLGASGLCVGTEVSCLEAVISMDSLNPSVEGGGVASTEESKSDLNFLCDFCGEEVGDSGGVEALLFVVLVVVVVEVIVVVSSEVKGKVVNDSLCGGAYMIDSCISSSNMFIILAYSFSLSVSTLFKSTHFNSAV